MADTNINHKEETAGNLSFNRQSPEVLLAKINDLEESLNSYATVFDYSPVGYVILDTKGVIIDANLTAATMVDMQHDKMVGFPFMMLVSEQDTQLFLDHLCRCKVSKSRVCTDIQIKTGSRTTYCVQIISLPFLLLDGKTVRYKIGRASCRERV